MGFCSFRRLTGLWVTASMNDNTNIPWGQRATVPQMHRNARICSKIPAKTSTCMEVQANTLIYSHMQTNAHKCTEIHGNAQKEAGEQEENKYGHCVNMP